jgi:hypothetical protein
MCATLQGGGSIENLDRTARQFLEFMAKMNSDEALSGPDHVHEGSVRKPATQTHMLTTP